MACGLNNLFRAPISFIQLDGDRLNKMFEMWKLERPFEFTTSSIAKFGKINLFE